MSAVREVQDNGVSSDVSAVREVRDNRLVLAVREVQDNVVGKVREVADSGASIG